MNTNLILTTLMYVFFAHWFADFLCQSQWMSMNKSKNNFALSYHILTYGLVLTTFLLFVFRPEYNLFYFCVINTLAHFCIDYISSRITSFLYKKGDIHNFFVVIGGDQLAHTSLLILTINLLVH